MNTDNLTETELERILRDSRFSNSEHKKDLHERIFGKSDRTVRQGPAQMPELSFEELELVAGGRAADPVIRSDKLQDM